MPLAFNCIYTHFLYISIYFRDNQDFRDPDVEKFKFIPGKLEKIFGDD